MSLLKNNMEMFKKGVLGFLLLFSALTSLCQTNYFQNLQHKRDSIDLVFSDSTKTILNDKALASFTGLDYYSINPNYKVVAKFKEKRGKPFEMHTSTKRLPVYRKYGELTFDLNGKKNVLCLYQGVKSLKNDSSVNDYLFCPFKDLSNKDSTYGGGRYLDFKLAEIGKTVIIDFNECYNPYCAYSNRYSCPVPPAENLLKIRIDAGVKKPIEESH